MDITNLESQITSQEALIASDKTTLANDQGILDNLNAELSVANLVNQLEALTADQITEINSLLSEPANILGLTLTIATPPASEFPATEEAAV